MNVRSHVICNNSRKSSVSCVTWICVIHFCFIFVFLFGQKVASCMHDIFFFQISLLRKIHQHFSHARQAYFIVGFISLQRCIQSMLEHSNIIFIIPFNKPNFVIYIWLAQFTIYICIVRSGAVANRGPTTHSIYLTRTSESTFN